MLFPGDPSMKSGNGIPARCVYLEEMAADLDDQDWLDMDNVEQVPKSFSYSIQAACPECSLSAEVWSCQLWPGWQWWGFGLRC